MKMVPIRSSFVACLVCAGPALAQETPPKATSEAKEAASAHFQSGVVLAQRGALAAAISEFEAAYAASPHYSVLYNIGQTEVARGRFVQAVAAFERYLAIGDKEITSDRRKLVLELIARFKRNIGALELEITAPATTRVWLDGNELRGEALTQPIVLSAGSHSLISASAGSEPVVHQVLIEGEVTTKTRIDAAEVTKRPDASLMVTCSTPDVLVTIDSDVVAHTPLTRPLWVTSGRRRLRFSRLGYATTERIVDLGSGGFRSVDCGVKVEHALSPAAAGRLQIRAQPPLARATVDGVPFVGNALPAGRHNLVVEHDGFVPHRGLVHVDAGRRQTIDVVLRPTPAGKLRRDPGPRERRRTLAYALGGGGVASLLASGGLAWWNQGRFEALVNEQTPTRNPDPNRVVAVQRIDDLSIGLATLGTGLVIAGVWWYVAPDDTD